MTKLNCIQKTMTKNKCCQIERWLPPDHIKGIAHTQNCVFYRLLNPWKLEFIIVRNQECDKNKQTKKKYYHFGGELLL